MKIVFFKLTTVLKFLALNLYIASMFLQNRVSGQNIIEIDPFGDLMDLFGSVNRKPLEQDNAPVQVFNLNDLFDGNNINAKRKKRRTKFKEVTIEVTNKGTTKTTRTVDENGNEIFEVEKTGNAGLNGKQELDDSRLGDEAFNAFFEEMNGGGDKKKNLSRSKGSKGENIFHTMDNIIEDLFFNMIHSPMNLVGGNNIQIIDLSDLVNNRNKEIVHTSQDSLEEERLSKIPDQELELDDLEKKEIVKDNKHDKDNKKEEEIKNTTSASSSDENDFVVHDAIKIKDTVKSKNKKEKVKEM